MTVTDSFPAADPITAADLLREGIQTADGGNRGKARFLVRQAVGYDPSNVSAWMWLAELVDSTEERIDCLRQVLARNPRIEQVLRRSSFLVDGAPAGTRDPATIDLPEGAVVEVLPPFAGG